MCTSYGKHLQKQQCAFSSSLWAGMQTAGFGAAVLDLEVETDKDGRVIIQKEHGVGIPHRSM